MRVFYEIGAEQFYLKCPRLGAFNELSFGKYSTKQVGVHDMIQDRSELK
jgi:hypothetical protein